MKKLPFLLLAICFACIACDNNNPDSTNQEEDSKKLKQMYQEIIQLSEANSQPCTDSKDWDFTAIGSQSCGGVAAYMMYSKKINKESFLAKVKAYTDAEIAYQKKWNILATCDILKRPTGVKCTDNKPQLSYDPI